MALLLAMYQKMKLIRQINQDTLKLTKITSKLDRMQKNIERVQKRYTSLFAQLDQQAKMMQSNAKLFFQNYAGLGNDCVNPYNYTGLNGFVYKNASSALTEGVGSGYRIYDKAEAGEKPTLNRAVFIDSQRFQQMWAEYSQYNGFPTKKDKDGNTEYITDENGNNIPVYASDWEADEVAAFKWAINSAKMQQQQTQMWVQQADTQYGNNISIWLDNAKAQLEAEQDAALEPLSYEDTMLQLEKEQLDARLQRLREEKQSYDTLVGEEAKNMAPTFGLR